MAEPNIQFEPIQFEPESKGIEFEPIQFESEQLGKSEQFISPDELEEIAKKHQADPEVLKNWANIYGATVSSPGEAFSLGETVKQAGLATLGTASSLVMELPQWAWKKAQEPNVRAALDEVKELAEERRPAAQDIGRVGVSVIGAKGLSKLIPKATGVSEKVYDTASAISGGAVSGLTGSKEGEEVEGAVIGAGIGALAIGGLKGIGALSKALGKVNEKEVVDAVGEAGDRIAEKANNILREEAQEIREAAEAVTRKDGRAAIISAIDSGKPTKGAEDLVSFASQVTRKPVGTLEEAVKLLDEREAVEGTEFLSREFSRFKEAEAFRRAIGDEVVAQIPESSNVLKKWASQIVNAESALRLVDRKLGTELEPMLHQAARNINNYTIDLGKVLNRAKPLVKESRKYKESYEKIYEALDTGKLSSLSEEEKTLATGYKQLFSELLEDVRKKGLPIEEITNYVPKRMVDLPEAMRRIYSKAKEVGQKVGVDLLSPNTQLSSELFEKVRNTEGFEELAKGVGILTKGAPAGDSALDFLSNLRRAFDPAQVRSKFETMAAAAQQREGEIPDFLLDKNLPSLLSRWAQNTYRHLHFRDLISELNKGVKIASDAGAKGAADYLQKQVADLAGIRQGTLSTLGKVARTNFQFKLKKLADEAKSPTVKSVYKFLGEDGPEFLSTIANQVYPNFLGLKIGPLIANLTTPLTMTVPELGFRYGATKVLPAMLRTVNELAVNRNLAEQLEKQGLKQKQWNTELRGVMERGISDSAVGSVAKETLGTWTDIAMYLYEKSEVLNRYVAKEVGTSVASDLLKSGDSWAKKQAQEFLSRAGKGLQRRAQGFIVAGDSERLTKLMEDYIVGKTVFNYSKASASEFARFMGPMFSVFTKWPSSIAGDVYTTLVEKGKVKGTAEAARKYMGTFISLYMLQRLVLGEPEEMSDVQKMVIGQAGLQRLAPVTSLGPLMGGEILRPPVINAIAEGILGLGSLAANQDPTPIWRWLNTTTQAFLPGGRLLELLTLDVPTISEGIRPEGRYIERAVPGSRETFLDIKDWLQSRGKGD